MDSRQLSHPVSFVFVVAEIEPLHPERPGIPSLHAAPCSAAGLVQRTSKRKFPSTGVLGSCNYARFCQYQ